MSNRNSPVDPAAGYEYHRHSRVSHKLRTLVTELHAEGDLSELCVDPLLLIYDIMLCLDLPPDEVLFVLGKDGLTYVTTILDSGVNTNG